MGGGQKFSQRFEEGQSHHEDSTVKIVSVFSV